MKSKPPAHDSLRMPYIHSLRSSENPAHRLWQLLQQYRRKIEHEHVTRGTCISSNRPLGGLDRWQPPMVQIYAVGWVGLFHRRIAAPTDSLLSQKSKGIWRNVRSERVRSTVKERKKVSERDQNLIIMNHISISFLVAIDGWIPHLGLPQATSPVSMPALQGQPLYAVYKAKVLILQEIKMFERSVDYVCIAVCLIDTEDQCRVLPGLGICWWHKLRQCSASIHLVHAIQPFIDIVPNKNPELRSRTS